MREESVFHTPALLKEVIEALQVDEGKRYIDATIGGGGHSFEILKRGGVVLGIDCDQEAIKYVGSRVQGLGFRENLKLARGNFKNLGQIALSNGFNQVAGILFDLGVSSYQLEEGRRGFSFRTEAPLDMRMDPSASSGQAVTAADLINGLTKEELYELFTKLGEEPYSWAISHSIVRARKIEPIRTTKELARLIVSIYRRYGVRQGKIHPATKVFQALRIAVNDELNNLKEALPQSLELLERSGRLVVLSYHSFEDRIIKQFAQEEARKKRIKILTKKPIIPTAQEIKVNPRSRSAKMRVLERMD